MTQGPHDNAAISHSEILSATLPKGVVFSGQQMALIRALEARDVHLSRMYRGGLVALGDAANPERFVHCAHSMRELIEKLPELLDVPTKALRESLKSKAQDLKHAHDVARRKSSCLSATGGWEGKIDSHLRKFITKVGEFLAWFAQHHPRRREEMRAVLGHLDLNSGSLPEQIANLNVTAFDEIRDYFQAVAHHRKNADDAEFQTWLFAIERFLLDSFAPRTFEDFSEIDSLFEEGETDA